MRSRAGALERELTASFQAAWSISQGVRAVATQPGGTISAAGYYGRGDNDNIPRIELRVGLSDMSIHVGLCPGGNVRMSICVNGTVR